jgi:hypothetical protein
LWVGRIPLRTRLSTGGRRSKQLHLFSVLCCLLSVSIWIWITAQGKLKTKKEKWVDLRLWLRKGYAMLDCQWARPVDIPRTSGTFSSLIWAAQSDAELCRRLDDVEPSSQNRDNRTTLKDIERHWKTLKNPKLREYHLHHIEMRLVFQITREFRRPRNWASIIEGVLVLSEGLPPRRSPVYLVVTRFSR